MAGPVPTATGPTYSPADAAKAAHSLSQPAGQLAFVASGQPAHPTPLQVFLTRTM